MTIPNRIVIGAIDTALNRLDLRAHAEGGYQANSKLIAELREERDALREARQFIIANRKEP